MDAARYAALFQSEAREHLADVDAALLTLEEACAASARAGSRHRGAPDGLLDPAEMGPRVATLFRGMHTIKGMAAAMGYAAVERLAHAMESRCEPLRSGSESVRGDVVALLLEGTAALRHAIDAAAEGREPAPATLALLLLRLRVDTAVAEPTGAHEGPATPEPTAALSGVDRGAARGAAQVAHRAAAANVRQVDVRLTDDCPLKGVRAMLVVAKLGQVGLVRATHPPQDRWQDDRFDGVFRVTLLSGADDEAIAAAARSAGDVARVQVWVPVAASAPAAALVAHPPGAVEADGDVQPTAAPWFVPGAFGAGETMRTVRVDAARLDTLLDLVGELVITRDRLLRQIEQQEHPDRALLRTARDTARLVAALHEEVLQSRLLPVAQVFDRFPRLVRDVARELGKEVAFQMEGREIELDRSLLEAAGDPILHLLRNALDHGIEDTVTRLAAGKAPRGTLVLRAARDRNTVVLQVQDDGRGIDRQAVLRRARVQGLVGPEVEVVDDDLLLQLVAHPGLSTADTVTALSGRGVGVDVVNTRVRALGGRLELETIAGAGTVVTMRLPLSLAITRALLVQVHGRTFALPASHVEEALEYHDSMHVHHADGPAVTVRDATVPLVALGERFRLGRSSEPGERTSGGERHLAIVESAGRRTALLVDALVAQQDIVVKPLDVVRGAMPWFSGATVLADGTPALIVDVAGVVQ
jgi:two-component system, chemotaxis family, sensor kinase CheA